MLSFDLRSLDAQAALVDGVLATDDPAWLPDDTRPLDGVHVTGRLSAAGPGRFYFSGRLEGTATDSCRRCLTDVQVPVAEEVHLLFADAGTEGSEEDPDVYVIDAREHSLDLRPAVREEWLLAVPPLVVCKEDCRGLCPKCGADLNLGECNCAPSIDPRWDALRGTT